MLDLGGEGLRLFIGNLGVILAQVFQDEVGDIFDIMLPFLFAADIIDLSRLEVINDIGEGAAGIFNIVEDALVPQVDGIRLISQCFIDEGGYDAAVGAVVLVRPVGIDRANPDCFRAEHSRRVQYLELAHPLGHGIVIHLFYGHFVHDILAHHAIIISIDLSAAEEYHPELFLFLKSYHILGADDIGQPEILIVVLAIPAPVFGGQVIDIVKVMLVKYPLKLAVFADIAADIIWPL